MNIDEITSKRQGGFPQANPTANAAAGSVPWDSQITMTTGVPVTKPCDHDWNFLEYVYTTNEDGEAVTPAVGHRFYCRRCLEYREVKR